MGEEYVTAPKDIDELSFGDFAGDRSCHTARHDDVTPYADTATRDNKREVATSWLAPVATAAMHVTCPYDTRADFCASAPVVACAAAAAAETGAPDEACPPGMPANAVCMFSARKRSCSTALTRCLRWRCALSDSCPGSSCAPGPVACDVQTHSGTIGRRLPSQADAMSWVL